MKEDDRSFWLRHKVTIISTSIGIVVGGLFGHVLDDPSVWAKGKIHETLCPTAAHLDAGRGLRKRALQLIASGEEGDLPLNREANREFGIAAECGSGLAKAHLGQAYCYGWAVEKNVGKGLNLIREGVRIEPTLEEWLLNPLICPTT